MTFHFAHMNINVQNIEEAEAFYREALGLTVQRRYEPEDGSFILLYLGDESVKFQLELTWLRDKEGAYALGDNETHLAFVTDDYAAAYAKHSAMDCICYENKDMGIYFIVDPDGHWIEVIPA